MSQPEHPRASGPPPAGPGQQGTAERGSVPQGSPPTAEPQLRRTQPGSPADAASPAPSSRPGQADLFGLRKELEDDIARIDGENREIDLLMEQVLVEIERHEGRRAKVESQLSTLERVGTADPGEVATLRENLLTLTRREMLFDAQRQVLEGKQRVLARFLQRLVEIDNSLAVMGGGTVRPTPVASSGLRALAEAGGGSGAPGLNQPASIMRSQEELRREIVRQIHDGPAQSLANIGMQAEIVERLVRREDPRAVDEIDSLRQLVQQALDTTKAFIFEIRPMVLDDLGLGPTLRRVANDRGRRDGINVEFDSQGIEERLDADIESVVYRSVVEAVGGYIELRPPSVLVRLDWGERELVATVEGAWPRVNQEGQAESSEMATSRSVETPPALLAMMEEKRSAERAADRAARSLPAEKVQVIEGRARAMGLTLTMRDDGQVMELLAPIRR